MSYQVLARKWRPTTLQTLIGQQHVVQTLTNALTQQRLHHAYLFTGTRGVGKTTLARIIAKCLNCTTGITATPCGTCIPCTAIDAGNFADLIEIDAASRTKVEDTREILDNVQYSTTQGRFKIYLIDEVHMLSKHSFNALLKTLEEPPDHVKFILATTDPQKLPITVLSRCLQLNLHHLSEQHISEHLQYVLQQEHINFEPDALPPLAQAAKGSMRDALSLLDQAIAYCGQTISSDAVNTMLGNVKQDFLLDLMAALIAQDSDNIIRLINHMQQQDINFEQALSDLLRGLHTIAVNQALSAQTDLITSSAWKNYAHQISPADVQLFYQIALIGQRDLPLAPTPRIGFEMTLLRMLAFQPETIHFNDVPRATAVPPEQPHTQRTKNVSTSAPASTPSPTDQETWLNLFTQLPLNGATRALASHCTLRQLTSETIELVVDPAGSALLTDKQRQLLTQALQKHFSPALKVNVVVDTSSQTTPAQQYQQQQQAKLAQAQRDIANNLQVKAIMEQFDATIVTDSIQPKEEM
ncbi:MAG: DNA polymerase III subunit gamma/tau [Gammaproteobacteria bacterium]